MLLKRIKQFLFGECVVIGRRDGLEDAARWHDAQAEYWDTQMSYVTANRHREHAAIIRGLKSK